MWTFKHLNQTFKCTYDAQKLWMKHLKDQTVFLNRTRHDIQNSESLRVELDLSAVFIVSFCWVTLWFRSVTDWAILSCCSRAGWLIAAGEWVLISSGSVISQTQHLWCCDDTLGDKYEWHHWVQTYTWKYVSWCGQDYVFWCLCVV